MNKNQAPKALPSWHASTSQPLSLNRITSRGFLLLSSPPPLSSPFPLLPLHVPPPREAALFLKLVLLLLLGSTCRYHAGVFVLRISRAQQEIRRGPVKKLLTNRADVNRVPSRVYNFRPTFGLNFLTSVGFGGLT